LRWRLIKQRVAAATAPKSGHRAGCPTHFNAICHWHSGGERWFERPISLIEIKKWSERGCGERYCCCWLGQAACFRSDPLLTQKKSKGPGEVAAPLPCGPRGFAVFGMYHKKKAAPVPKGRKVSCDREGCNGHSRNSCRYRRCANSCQYALNPEQGLQERLSRLVRPNFYSAASF